MRIEALMLGIIAIGVGQSSASGFSLLPGDIVSVDAIHRQVVRVDPQTGAANPITSAFGFSPGDIVVSPEHQIYVTDQTGGVWDVDPTTGAQQRIDQFQLPRASLLAIEKSGTLIVDCAATLPDHSFGEELERLDPTTGNVSLLTYGNYISGLRDLAVSSDGGIFATTNYGIVKIDPVTGAQSPGSNIFDTLRARGIAIDDAGNIVVGVPTMLSTGFSGVIRVDPATDKSTVLYASSSVNELTQIGDMVIQSDGRVLIDDLSDGLVRIDPATHQKTFLIPGPIDLSSIAIVPVPEPVTGLLVISGLASLLTLEGHGRRRKF